MQLGEFKLENPKRCTDCPCLSMGEDEPCCGLNYFDACAPEEGFEKKEEKYPLAYYVIRPEKCIQERGE